MAAMPIAAASIMSFEGQPMTRSFLLVAAIGTIASASLDRNERAGALTVARKLPTDNACIEANDVPGKPNLGEFAESYRTGMRNPLH
jgi:hypothetical protein